MAARPETEHEKMVLDLVLGCVHNGKYHLNQVYDEVQISPLTDLGKRRFCYLLHKRGFRLREFREYSIWRE